MAERPLDGAPAREKTDEEHDGRHDEQQPEQIAHPDSAACRGEHQQNDQQDQKNIHAASFEPAHGLDNILPRLPTSAWPRYGVL